MFSILLSSLALAMLLPTNNDNIIRDFHITGLANLIPAVKVTRLPRVISKSLLTQGIGSSIPAVQRSTAAVDVSKIHTKKGLKHSKSDNHLELSRNHLPTNLQIPLIPARAKSKEIDIKPSPTRHQHQTNAVDYDIPLDATPHEELLFQFDQDVFEGTTRQADTQNLAFRTEEDIKNMLLAETQLALKKMARPLLLPAVALRSEEDIKAMLLAETHLALKRVEDTKPVLLPDTTHQVLEMSAEVEEAMPLAVVRDSSLENKPSVESHHMVADPLPRLKVQSAKSTELSKVASVGAPSEILESLAEDSPTSILQGAGLSMDGAVLESPENLQKQQNNERNSPPPLNPPGKSSWRESVLIGGGLGLVGAGVVGAEILTDEVRQKTK